MQPPVAGYFGLSNPDDIYLAFLVVIFYLFGGEPWYSRYVFLKFLPDR